MAHWTNRSWLASVGVVLLASSVAGGVVGCSKKKDEDTKAKAEKAKTINLVMRRDDVTTFVLLKPAR